MILPVLAYVTIDLTLLRFVTVCLLSILSTIGMGFYLGFNQSERLKIRTKVVSVINTKILKR